LIAWGLVSLAAPPLDTTQVEAIPIALVSLADATSPPKPAPPAPAAAKPAPATPAPPPASLPVAPAMPQPPTPAVADAKPQPPPPAPASPPPVPVAAQPAPDAATTVASIPAPPPKPRASAPPKPAATTADRPFFLDRIGALLNGAQPRAQSTQAPVPARPAPAASPAQKPQPDALALGSVIASASAADAHMTVNEVDALRARIAACWTPPAGWSDPAEVRVVMIIALSPDGSVAAPPQVVDVPVGRYAQTAPESAVRAVRACAPYVLPPEKYPDWKQVKITFDPRAMGN
jgi:hypothetical protein